MRLLHVYGGNRYGGVERLLVSLAQFQHLAPGLHQEFALCYPGRLSRELEASGATVHWLGGVRVSRPWQVAAARRRLRRWLDQHRFDLALCHSWWPYAIFGPALRRAGMPVGLWGHETVTGRGWLQRWAGSAQPDFLLVCTAAMATAARRLYPALEAGVVAPPVPAPKPLSAAERETLRQQFGAERETMVLLQVGRMEPLKGHRLLLEALARLGEVPGWVVWFAGGPQRPAEHAYMQTLRQHVIQLGMAERVHWLGERTDMDRLLGAADIFCQPNSQPETFGLALVEALAAGLPAAATALGGALGIVTQECGRFAPPNPGALAAVLRPLIEDAGLRCHLARQAPARARLLCDPETQMLHLQTLLAEKFAQLKPAAAA